jgi:hypothetical protein
MVGFIAAVFSHSLCVLCVLVFLFIRVFALSWFRGLTVGAFADSQFETARDLPTPARKKRAKNLHHLVLTPPEGSGILVVQLKRDGWGTRVADAT